MGRVKRYESFTARSFNPTSGARHAVSMTLSRRLFTNSLAAQVNKELTEAGHDALSNTRNAAAGALRLLDPSECASRRLSFVAYQLLALPQEALDGLSPGLAPPSTGDGPAVERAPLAFLLRQSECLSWLSSRGFATSTDARACHGGIEEALKAAEIWMSTRKDLGGRSVVG